MRGGIFTFFLYHEILIWQQRGCFMSTTQQARIRFFPDSPPEIFGASKWEFLLDVPQGHVTHHESLNTPQETAVGMDRAQIRTDEFLDD